MLQSALTGAARREKFKRSRSPYYKSVYHQPCNPTQNDVWLPGFLSIRSMLSRSDVCLHTQWRSHRHPHPLRSHSKSLQAFILCMWYVIQMINSRQMNTDIFPSTVVWPIMFLFSVKSKIVSKCQVQLSWVLLTYLAVRCFQSSEWDSSSGLDVIFHTRHIYKEHLSISIVSSVFVLLV